MKLYLLLLFYLLTTTSFTQNFWEPIYGPYDGAVGKIAVSPKGYIFSSSFSLNCSTDGGHKWMVSFPSYGCRSSYLSINSRGDIYVHDMGLCRSTDDGVTWALINKGVTYCIEFLGDNVIFAGTAKGVIRSSDNGNTWVTAASTENSILALKILNKEVYAGGYKNLIKSKNGGKSWEKVNNPAADNVILSIAADSNGVLFIAGGLGVFSSSDSGINWKLCNNGLPNNQKQDFTPRSIISLQQLYCHSDGTLYAVTNSGLFISTDEGNNWFKTFINSNYNATGVAEDTSGNVLASLIIGEGGGIYRTSNKGESWEKIGVKNVSTPKLLLTSEGDIYAMYNCGVSRSTNKGQSWDEIIISDLRYSCIAIDSSFFYLGGYTLQQGMSISYNPIFKLSFDKGEHWLTSHLSASDLQIDSEGNLLRVTDDGELYKSTDHGSSWLFLYNFNYMNIYLAALSNKEILVSTHDSIFRSTDNGVSWDKAKTSISRQLKPIIKVPDGYYFALNKDSLYRSIDGITWTGLLGIRGFGRFLVNRSDRIFTVSYDGIIYSEDNGNTWIPLDNNDWEKLHSLGLQGAVCGNKGIIDLVIDKDGYIFASTNYMGIIKSVLPFKGKLKK